MALTIKWTEIALADYKQIVDYLLQKWPFSVALDFVNTVETRVKTLAQFPGIGIISQKEPGIRSIILTKHNRLYYRFDNNLLEILAIFDTRQYPGKNKFD